MSALRDFLATLLGGSAVATGADTARPVAGSHARPFQRARPRTRPSIARRTDREREIELRILMSNWM